MTDAADDRSALVPDHGRAVLVHLADLIEARVRVLDQIQRDRNEMNQALAQYSVPAPVRWRLVIRDRPAHPHSPRAPEQWAAAERMNEATPTGH